MGGLIRRGARVRERPQGDGARFGPIERILAAAGAVATITGTLIALWLVFLPGGPESCSKEGASLANITVEERVAFRDYLERTNASTAGYVARQLEMLVNLISYDLHVDGFKGKHLTSKWSVYDAKTNSAVGDELLRNRLALDVEPTACETRLHPAIWTPAVVGSGHFYKVFVYDDKGTLLAERRSAPLLGQP